MQKTYRLLIDCPDQVGLVAAVSQFLAQYNAAIVEASHHTDIATQRFFMRHEICADSVNLDHQTFSHAFDDMAKQYQMRWKLSDSQHKPRIALLASKESHCLVDLLHRWHTGELHCDISCVIANHPQMRQFAEWYEVPFFHIDFQQQDKTSAFAEIEQLIDSHKVDLTILARFMQILPNHLCEKLAGHIINIHHSFLPSFAGARPYQQAYDRGVKLIGATCHYVTADLDEGPIIEQSVKRISHSDNPADMVRKGKDCEVTALAHGVRYHLQDRVIIHRNKTVVFA